MCYFCAHSRRREEDVRCPYSLETGKDPPQVGVTLSSGGSGIKVQENKRRIVCLSLLLAGQHIFLSIVAAAAKAAPCFIEQQL